MAKLPPATPEEMWATLDYLSGPEIFRIMEHSSPFLWGVKMLAVWDDKSFYAAYRSLTEPTYETIEILRLEMIDKLKAQLWEAIHEGLDSPT